MNHLALSLSLGLLSTTAFAQCDIADQNFDLFAPGTSIGDVPGWTPVGLPGFTPTVEDRPSGTPAIRMGFGSLGGTIASRQLQPLPPLFEISFDVIPGLSGRSEIQCPFSPSNPNDVRGTLVYTISAAGGFVQSATSGITLPIIPNTVVSVVMAVNTSGNLVTTVNGTTLEVSAWDQGTACLSPNTLNFFANGATSGGQGALWVDNLCIKDLSSFQIDAPYACASVPNSTGAIAGLSATGSTSISFNSVLFGVDDLPLNEWGMLVTASEMSLIIMPDYTLCLGNTTTRLVDTLSNSGASGSLAVSFDLTTPVLIFTSAAPVTAGSTWYYHWYFRDSIGVGFNFSAATSITFTP